MQYYPNQGYPQQQMMMQGYPQQMMQYQQPQFMNMQAAYQQQAMMNNGVMNVGGVGYNPIPPQQPQMQVNNELHAVGSKLTQVYSEAAKNGEKIDMQEAIRRANVSPDPMQYMQQPGQQAVQMQQQMMYGQQQQMGYAFQQMPMSQQMQMNQFAQQQYGQPVIHPVTKDPQLMTEQEREEMYRLGDMERMQSPYAGYSPQEVQEIIRQGTPKQFVYQSILACIDPVKLRPEAKYYYNEMVKMAQGYYQPAPNQPIWAPTPSPTNLTNGTPLEARAAYNGYGMAPGYEYMQQPMNTNSYLASGYYGNSNYNSYNPYYAPQQQQAQEAMIKEQQLANAALQKRLYKTSCKYRGVECTEEDLKQFDPAWKQEQDIMNELTYEQQQEYYKIKREKETIENNNRYFQHLVSTNQLYEYINPQWAAAVNRYVTETEAYKASMPEGIGLAEYFNDGYASKDYNAYIMSYNKAKQQDLSRLYNHKDYKQLVDYHRQHGVFSYNSNLDDQEVPLYVSDKQRQERRRAFINSLLNKMD